jgi:hypothetical protein
VALVEGAEPAAANEDPPKSLKRRMADIRDECAGVDKQSITMGNFTIQAHTIEGVLAGVRPLLTKHGVDVTPILIERTYTGNRCDVLVDWVFERTDDSDETRTIRWAGAGTDNSDKAFAKAGTNCLKEMLKKRFLITDRDDTKEETESVEHRTGEGVAREDLERAQSQRKAAIEQWAKALKMALEKATSRKDVERLERENRDQLISEDLPDVTRSFFAELIDGRKRDLA